MKIKNYSLYGKVLDKNGQEHVVTVVGQLVKEKEIVEGVIDNHEVSICGKKEKKLIAH